MNWKKYFAEHDERKRWDMLMKENEISCLASFPYGYEDKRLLDLRRWMIEEIMDWCWKNNTIPLPDSNLRICSTDGGWCNVLKLKKFLEETIK